MRTVHELVETAVNHHKRGEFDEAEGLYRFLLGAIPGNPAVLYGMGNLLVHRGEFGMAIPFLQASLAIIPEQPWVMSNLAVCFRREGHEETAQKLYAQAHKMAPKDADTLAEMAGAYINCAKPSECVKWAEKALEIDPDHLLAQFHRAIGLLEMGEYEEGFKGYDSRLEIAKRDVGMFMRFGVTGARTYPFPAWDGSPVDTLVVHGEQGLGDELMFLGWLKDVPAKRIVIECNDRLVPAVARSFGEAYPDEKAVCEAVKDAHVVAMGSLPNYSKERLVGYLKPNPEYVAEFKERLGPGRHIGISWFGGSKATHGHLRSAPPSEWKKLIEGRSVISLQYGPAGEEGARHLGIPHWQEDIDNVDRLIALIAVCDLVISVNNSTVHMAGAMNKDCFTFTPSKPAWRYGLTGERMPWYPSVRQFRQVGNDWSVAFDRAKEALNGDLRRAG